MKNVVIILAGSNAVVVSEKQYKSGKCKVFSASTTTASALQAFNFVMSLASTNETIDKDIVRIFIPDVIKGFSMGTYVDYIRTGKTSGNRKFTEEEFALVKECALNICNRGLNLKVAETKFMPKELKEFKDGAFKIAKQIKEELANKPQQVVSAPVDPRIAKLQELMVKALDDGDFDKYDALEERLNKITQGQPAPQAQQPVEESAEEDNEVVVENTEEENEDEPEEVDVDEDLANLDI
jgi:hypothetical protein